jgi:TatD DNase family protein
MYTDSHAHLTVPAVVDHVEEILQRAQQKGVSPIVNICVDGPSLEKGLHLAQRHPWVFNAAATTPHDVDKEGEVFFPVVERMARERKLVAIGETGLDYHYEHSSKEKQREFLVRYFKLAVETQLPVIFHCREAFGDLFDLGDHHYKERPAVLHCFTGSLEEVKGCLERGWYISLSGIVTFKKSEKLREVAKYVPLDRLFIETDTPYLAPQSKRGKANEPSFIAETAKVLAEVKGVSVEDLAAATAANAAHFFSFPKHLLSV